MRACGWVIAAMGALAFGGCSARADEPVRVTDDGERVAPATWECTPGHSVAKHKVTLACGDVVYAFLASGCQDPSHEGLHPCSEGNFGMPAPASANWYWGGFLRVLVNGSDATVRDIRDLRVLEEGERGGFQIVWSHPDAEVGLRLMLRSGSNHVDALLMWRAREGAAPQSLKLELRCYPSYFTAANHRQGERHCRTPRIDQAETSTLELAPAEDAWLYYYDTVFDLARGEGGGPCAALIAPEAVRGGTVHIGDYAVLTTLDLAPEAGEARLALYDFTGRTNAEAEAYLREHAEEDAADLSALDFRPGPARLFDAERFASEAHDLLARAADDGAALEPQVRDLIARTTALKAAADAGDWIAEADLCAALRESEDLLWKLRTFAVLNDPWIGWGDPWEGVARRETNPAHGGALDGSPSRARFDGVGRHPHRDASRQGRGAAWDLQPRQFAALVVIVVGAEEHVEGSLVIADLRIEIGKAILQEVVRHNARERGGGERHVVRGPADVVRDKLLVSGPLIPRLEKRSGLQVVEVRVVEVLRMVYRPLVERACLRGLRTQGAVRRHPKRLGPTDRLVGQRHSRAAAGPDVVDLIGRDEFVPSTRADGHKARRFYRGWVLRREQPFGHGAPAVTIAALRGGPL